MIRRREGRFVRRRIVLIFTKVRDLGFGVSFFLSAFSLVEGCCVSV